MKTPPAPMSLRTKWVFVSLSTIIMVEMCLLVYRDGQRRPVAEPAARRTQHERSIPDAKPIVIRPAYSRPATAADLAADPLTVETSSPNQPPNSGSGPLAEPAAERTIAAVAGEGPTLVAPTQAVNPVAATFPSVSASVSTDSVETISSRKRSQQPLAAGRSDYKLELSPLTHPSKTVMVRPPIADQVLASPATVDAQSAAIPRQALQLNTLTAEQRRELMIAAERADQHVRKAMNVATRGAIFTARGEFIQALRLIAEARDGISGQAIHGAALSRGLRVLEEAADFMPRGARLEADIDMQRVIASHRTPILKTPAGDAGVTHGLTPRTAANRYYIYAYEQFMTAVGSLPVSSMALYGLGKIHTTMAETRPDDREIEEYRAMVLHQAAVAAAPNNPLAANELGVLLAKYGRLVRAQEMLTRSAHIKSQPATWQNLATVYERMGNSAMAQYARQRAAGDGSTQYLANGQPQVYWVPNQDFGRTPVPTAAPTVGGYAPAAVHSPIAQPAAAMPNSSGIPVNAGAPRSRY